MRPSKTAIWRLHDSALSGSSLPGARTSEAVIGSITLRRCASVTGTAFGGSGDSGVIEYSFTLPPLSVTRISSVFLSVEIDAE